MKERKIKIDIDGIGTCIMRVSNVGVHLKRGRRELHLSWNQFWNHVLLPLDAAAKFHATPEMKKQWLIEARKADA